MIRNILLCTCIMILSFLSGCHDSRSRRENFIEAINQESILDSIISLKKRVNAKILVFDEERETDFIKYYLEYPTDTLFISSNFNLAYVEGVAIIKLSKEANLESDDQRLDRFRNIGIVKLEDRGQLTHYPGYVFYRCKESDLMKAHLIQDVYQLNDSILNKTGKYPEESFLAPRCK